jgi:hypothetical protein
LLNEIFIGPSSLNRIAKEPPFRLLVKKLVRSAPVSIRVKAAWDAVSRPNYLVGVLTAADEAVRAGVPEITVIEFGVGGGGGLLALQEISEAVEAETRVKILVCGFDTGTGLPPNRGDFRDHPDRWIPGDFPMNEPLLRKRLTSRTTLILGDVVDTVPRFAREAQHSPIGFVAVDLDLYSSTRNALQILTLPEKRMLVRVPMYFDDISLFSNHKFAGELLAIDKFNDTSPNVKIDRWRGFAATRAFPESSWVSRMYIAHDLAAISRITTVRDPLVLASSEPRSAP